MRSKGWKRFVLSHPCTEKMVHGWGTRHYGPRKYRYAE